MRLGRHAAAAGHRDPPLVDRGAHAVTGMRGQRGAEIVDRGRHRRDPRLGDVRGERRVRRGARGQVEQGAPHAVCLSELEFRRPEHRRHAVLHPPRRLAPAVARQAAAQLVERGQLEPRLPHQPAQPHERDVDLALAVVEHLPFRHRRQAGEIAARRRRAQHDLPGMRERREVPAERRSRRPRPRRARPAAARPSRPRRRRRRGTRRERQASSRMTETMGVEPTGASPRVRGSFSAL